MDKRGQAAMEFLMTYGWAILAALIAIGVLIYFGVFSPGRYFPESCLLSPPLGCDNDETLASAANGVTLVVSNGGGDTIFIQEIEITGCATEDHSAAPLEVESGGTVSEIVTCSPALDEDAQFRGNIELTYTKAGSSTELYSTGSLAKRVRA